MKIPMSESLFNEVADLRPAKETLAQVFAYGFCKISKTTSSIEHL